MQINAAECKTSSRFNRLVPYMTAEKKKWQLMLKF